MRKIVDVRLAITLLVVAILALSQFLLRGEGLGGSVCRSSLVSPSTADQQTDLYTFYGFPLTFMATFTQGCFESRTTRTDWYAGGLLVDVLFVGGLGTLAYWFVQQWQRFRHRQITQADTRQNE
jgi:hypothetical protein